MGAFTELSSFLREDLCAAARRLNYSEALICILEGKDVEVEHTYPMVYNNILSCRHNRDGRAPFDYARDLIASWIFEDYLIQQIKIAGINIAHAGADRKREILPSNKVSSASDCITQYHGISRKLEIMTDYKGYWSRNKRIDLRDDKFIKMRRENSIFLGFSTIDSKYIIIDFRENVEAEYTSYHYPYKKPAYFIPIKGEALKPFDIHSLVEHIKSIF